VGAVGSDIDTAGRSEGDWLGAEHNSLTNNDPLCDNRKENGGSRATGVVDADQLLGSKRGEKSEEHGVDWTKESIGCCGIFVDPKKGNNILVRGATKNGHVVRG
jgi:hypothetical protein